MRRHQRGFWLAIALVLWLGVSLSAQEYSQAIKGEYVFPSLNVTYMKSGAWEGKLDIFARRDAPGPHPTLIYVHGGAQCCSAKENALFFLLPYLERGWNVVNIEHRMPGVTLAPAALRNTLCAVRWVVQNAGKYGFDASRLVISGESSGGWFAVAAGLGVRPPGWDEACPGPAEPKVAAVVNWYGNWDLADILEGENRKGYAAGWVANLPNPMDVARSLSALPLRTRDLPAVISIHGDADATVPYSQSLRLHEALKLAQIPEELLTISGGKHGGFTREEHGRAYAAIDAFLAQQGIGLR